MCSYTLGASALGRGLGIAGDAVSANQADKTAKRQAKVAKGLADQASARVRNDWRQQIAKQQVAFAKGGVTTEGTPTDVLMDLSRKADVDARTARFKGYDDARSRLQDAKYRRTQSFLNSLGAVSGYGTDIARLADQEGW